MVAGEGAGGRGVVVVEGFGMESDPLVDRARRVVRFCAAVTTLAFALAPGALLAYYPPLTNIVQIDGGYGHTCALTDAGGVKCWGGNGWGQLGNGTTNYADGAVHLPALASGVASIALGSDHGCALTVAGGVKCWGRNFDGQLGNGTRIDSKLPVDVPGLTANVVKIAAGGDSTCALTAAGAVKCWGRNSLGQVGDGTTTMALLPTDVIGLSSGMADVATSGARSCALTVSGAAKCWGWNVRGQLGDGAFVDAHAPVDVVPGAAAFTGIVAGGTETCALGADGRVWCWGDQQNPGVPVTADQARPRAFDALGSGVAALAAGNGHMCALIAGKVRCWGYNRYGQLGDGTVTSSALPVEVPGLDGVTALGTGNVHSCAIVADGARCWGDNVAGQLGNSVSFIATHPMDVVGFGATPAAIDAGHDHTCAITATGGVKCWGLGARVGIAIDPSHGPAVEAPEPRDIPGLAAGVTAIALGDSHTCALTSAGGVKCWGSNLVRCARTR